MFKTLKKANENGNGNIRLVVMAVTFAGMLLYGMFSGV